MPDNFTEIHARYEVRRKGLRMLQLLRACDRHQECMRVKAREKDIETV